MSDWREAELGDHVDLLAGFAFKSAQFSDDPAGCVRLLRGDNVGQGALRWTGAKHWSAAEYPDFERYHLCEDDVILAMDRPWIEAGLKYAYIRQSDLPCLLVQRVSRMRGLQTLDTKFLRYLIGSEAFTGHVKAIITGVNVPHISGRDIKRFRFKLPPLGTQRRIASILGAYDNLIDVNRRRVAVLEEMARGLFEEWFVRFRFPGHEAVPIVDTPDGPLPEGWSWGIVGDLATNGGRSINPAAFQGEVFAHHSIPAFDDDRYPAMDAGGTIKSNKLEFQAPVILVSKLNPRFPRIWYIPDNLSQRQIASTEFVPLFPSGGCLAWLYAVVRGAEFTERLTAMAGGTSTSHQRVKPKDILNTPIALPPSSLLGKADQALTPIFDMVRAAEAANRSLAAARDLLLPRLISGQLTVRVAERELEEAA